MRFKPILMALAIGALAMTTAACGKTVPAGEVGIKVNQYGGGIDGPLPQGWHGTGFGQHIFTYPIISRTYAYTREPNRDGAENEEITFSDNNALSMTADVQMVVSIDSAHAVNLYKTYRLTFDELLDGPIRNDVRSFIAAESELVSVEYLYKGGRQEMIHKALAKLQQKWGPKGITISQLDWIGPIRYPDIIVKSIQAKTKADADTISAQARVAVATAEAQAKVEEAKGEAESIRLKGEALRTSPEVVEQIYAQRSRGWCPPKAQVCILGTTSPLGLPVN